MAAAPWIGWAGLIVLGGPVAALHASLRHEALHGHPTSDALVNEALVFPSLDLLFPYRRFKELHLRHHCDERVTDPYDDPESWYVAERDWRDAGPLKRAILRANATLGGRLLVGPWLSAAGLWRADALRFARSAGVRRKLATAYGLHAIGVGIALGGAYALGGVSPLTYLLCVAWPAVGFLMLRSYIEHRAAEDPAHRSAVVEAEPLFALIFLNNNLHALHHAHPRVPWSRLPALWRAHRDDVLARNGGYHVPGYLFALRSWLLTPREPIAHPYRRREK